jgi:uncharacterized protein (TIGR03437 family)
MVYDAARNQIVLFGGRAYPGQDNNDTWVWDGWNWTQKFPAHQPSARSGMAMAYDALHQQVVLFGGQVNCRYSGGAESQMFGTSQGDTWTWNGADWTQITPAKSPEARGFHGMAYDAVRQRVVLFGGINYSSTFQVLGDTWTWDGTTWTQQSPTYSPPARRSHMMAWDDARGQVVLYGGTAALYDAGGMEDTWVWDGANWTVKDMWGVPGLVWDAAMTYDSDRRRIVMTGGFVPGAGYNDDEMTSYEWDGQQWDRTGWTQYGSGPYSRRGHTMAYDPVRNQTVFFGGDGIEDSTLLTDTWFYVKGSFVERPPQPTPGASMVYDAATQQMVMLAGATHRSVDYWGDGWDEGGQGDSETYIWDGARWHISTGNGVTQWRCYYAMAYDAVRQQVVLFGGYYWDNNNNIVYLNDTWVWDGTNWTKKSPATSPSARLGAAMAFDAVHNNIVLMGGYNGGNNYLNDTWTWDGTNWTQVVANTPMSTLSDGTFTLPALRQLAGMAWDPVRQKVTLFGGLARWCTYAAYCSSTWVNAYVNDTWTWDGAKWTQILPIHAPPERESPGMDWDGNLGKMLVFGGDSATLGTLNDTWTWDGTDWTQLTPANSPPAREYFAMAFDVAHSRMLMFGGVGTTALGGTQPDMWDFGPPIGGNILVQTNIAGAGYSISGPSLYNGSGASSDWNNAPVGSYTITYNSVAGWIAPASETQTLTAGGTVVFAHGYLTAPGSVSVSANIAAAGFTIVGELPMSGSGTTYSRSGVPPGTYTISWTPVGGYITPTGSSATLAAGGSISFTGTYTLLPVTGTINVSTNASGASFDLSGPASYSGTNSLTQTGAPPGAYTITYNSIGGFITPPPETKTLLAGNSIAFTGNYSTGSAAPSAGWMLMSPKYPIPRNTPSIVYDAARGQTVLFGGFRGFPTGESDTWVWDDTRWIHKSPVTSPPGRTGALMVYDGTHQLVMMMGGGSVASGANTDVWLWDGTNWTRKVPAHPVIGQFAAYDAARQQVVMIVWDKTNYCNDTWTWDGTDWTQQHPALSPGYNPTYMEARSLVYDAQRQRVVLLAYDWDWEETHTFLWDGTNWTDMGKQHPGPIYGATLYDPVRQQVVSFGGEDDWASTSDPSQVWAWNGTQWNVTATVTTRPPHGGTVMYDTAGSQFIEVATGSYNDIWTWDGSSASWIQRTLSPDGPSEVRGVMAYDSVRDQTVLYGGVFDTMFSMGWLSGPYTWIWNGVNWTQTGVPGPNPARTTEAAAFDPVRGQLVLFGGSDTYYQSGGPSSGGSEYFNDTWVWDGIQWTQKTPAVPAPNPAARIDHMMVWDGLHQKILLFGGKGATSSGNFAQGAMNDTWTWDGANWTQASPSTSPPARGAGALVYDDTRQVVVLYGGYSSSGAKLNDMWEWNGTTWTQRTFSGGPAARSHHRMAYDSYRHQTVLVSGQSGVTATPYFSDIWTWDGSSWTQQTPSLSPPVTESPVIAYDSARHQTLLWGGLVDSAPGSTPITGDTCSGGNCVYGYYYGEEMWAWGDSTGSISVSTNLSAATFLLSGPVDYSGSGTAFSQAAAPAADYTIIYASVSGYASPPIETKTLPVGDAISFTGTYVPIASAQGSISVTTNLSAALFTITGAAGFSGSGTWWAQANCPPGTYTVTFAAVPGYVTPAPQTQTLTAGGSLSFSVAYTTGGSRLTVSGFANPATAGASSTFTVAAQDSGGNSLTGYTGTVAFGSSDTQAALPANYTFVAGDGGVHQFSATLKTAGTQSITATDSADSLSGSQSGIVVQAGAAASIAATGGTPQSTAINAAFTTALQATVKDSCGNPVSGVTVNFSAPSSGAGATLSAASASTNASGVASVNATANGTTGAYNATATVTGVSGGANFALTNLAGVPAAIAVYAGNNQTATVGTALSVALAAKVTDGGGNPLSGVAVTFTAPTSGAGGSFASNVAVSTNGSGIATASTFTANGTAGAYSVKATVAGVATPATFAETNQAGAAASIAATGGTPQSASLNSAFPAPLQATVLDSYGNPVSGVTVNFAVPSSGASATLSAASAATNASGVASVTATANGTAGAFNATASVAGLPGTATFALTNVTMNVTVQTSPAGLTFWVDGAKCTGAQAFTFTPGSTHTLSVSSPIATVAGTQLAFSAWSDGQAMTHTITVPSTPTTYTASFTTQYLLTTGASPIGAGSVTPASGYFNAGSTVALHASPSGGSIFHAWSGPVAATGSPDTTVAMTGPLSVTASFQSTNAGLSPNPVALAYYLGTDPSTAAVPVTVSADSPDTFFVSLASTAPGLIAVKPASGTTPGTIVVSPAANLTLAAGTYATQFDVVFSDGTRITEPVQVQIFPLPTLRAVPTALSFAAQSGSTTASTQVQAVTAYTRNMDFMLSVTYASAADPPWLKLGAAGGTTPLTFNATADPTGLTAGTHLATILATAASAANSPLAILVTFTIAAPPPPPPAIAVSDIKNAASYLSGPASPNEILSAFGSFPGCTAAQVLVDGAAATVFYSSAAQVNFLMPAQVVSEPSATLQFVCNGITSPAMTVAIANAAPGVFTAAQNGTGQAAIVNQDGSLSAPAPAGTYVQVYGTGFGPYNAPGADGLLRLAGTVTATLGGVPATVLYAGQAPGWTPGLQQIDVLIPAGAASGPLALKVGAATSQTGVTLMCK